MNDTSERDAVIQWLKITVGWNLHKIEEKTKGRSVYVFWEGDTGGWNIVHSFKQDQLRWRYMRGVAFDHIPELRKQVSAIWEDYVRGVSQENELRNQYVKQRAAAEADPTS